MNTSPPLPRSIPSARPSGRRSPLGRVLITLVALVFVATASPARAGWDDFEFGRKLIDRGYLDYAKRVFDEILAHPKSTQAQKDEALFGTALLGKADLNSAQGDPKTSLVSIKSKLDAAAGQIQDFVTKNANGPKGTEAKIALGLLHLGFVQWCTNEIEREAAYQNAVAEAASAKVDPPKDVAPLKQRGTTVDELRASASDSAARAAEVFSGVRDAAGAQADRARGAVEKAKAEGEKQLAEFQYLSAQYFKASTLKKCSTEAIAAFQSVRKQLEDYAFANEQYITGTYALDFLGKTSQELADCENDEALKLRGYQSAMDNYLAAASTDDQGEEYRKLICTGFLHIAQLGSHLADRRGDVKFSPLLKSISQQLENVAKAPDKAPWVKKFRPGLFGMIAWAEFLSAGFDRNKEAVEILKTVSEAAAASGWSDLAGLANSTLQRIFSLKGSSGEAVDVTVAIKLADNAFSKGKFSDAVAGYQKVVAAAPKDREGLVKYYLYGWARIGACYTALKLPMEAASAYDVIADEVRGGRVVLTSSEDTLGKLVIDAFTRQRAALLEVSNRTSDPVAKKRLDAFTDFQIDELGKIPASGGGSGGGAVSELAYRRATDTFRNALAKRTEAPNDAEWKSLLKDSVQHFETTAAAFTSEYQDAAWVYLVRIPYELGDLAAVGPAVDRALAFWETPASKKRATTEEKIGASRPAQVAAVTYWKAAALVAAKNDDGAMEILEGYKAKFGRDATFYLGWAMGLRVEVLLRRQKIADAESAIDELIKEFPDYHRLPAIVVQQAEYYRGKESEVQKKIDEVVTQDIGDATNRAGGAKARLAAAYIDDTNTVNVISDCFGVISRSDAIIAKSEGVTDHEKDLAKKAKADAEKRLVEAQARLSTTRKDIETLTKLRADLATQKAALVREQIPFLRKTAELYRKLDDLFKGLDAKAAKGAGKKRRAENVGVLAFRYYKLAKTDPTDTTSWSVARTLYEDWLAFPDVAALPETDAGKRRTSRLLGEIYYRLAGETKTADEKLVAAKAAVNYLEKGLAKLAVNTPLVLGNLSGELVVLPYKDGERTWRIPVRRSTDAKQFKESVAGLLSGGGVPKFVRESDDQLFQRAIGAFQRRVAGMSDAELAATVASLKNGGFDALFFADHVDTDVASLFALAHSYQNSGVADDAGKAVNVASVISSRADEDSSDWWEAETIKLEVRVAAAERALSSGGTAAPAAKSGAEQAKRQLEFTKSNRPHIGGLDRHDETLVEWNALKARLNVVLGKLGLPATTVNLEAELAQPAPDAPAAPPSPPATPAVPPTQPDPGMADSGMADAGMDDAPMPPDAPKDK